MRNGKRKTMLEEMDGVDDWGNEEEGYDEYEWENEEEERGDTDKPGKLDGGDVKQSARTAAPPGPSRIICPRCSTRLVVKNPSRPLRISCLRCRAGLTLKGEGGTGAKTKGREDYSNPDASRNCSVCGGETQYSEDEDDYYCWECEEYIGEM
jgi:hypothetical protein